SILARQYADDRAEIEKLEYRAVVDLPDLDLRGEFQDPLLGEFASIGGYACDSYRTVLRDIDGCSGLFGKRAYYRSALADHVTYLLGLDLQRDHAWRICGNVGPRIGDALLHDPEDMHAPLLRLIERDLHD